MKLTLTINDRAELLLTNNPHMELTHATFTEPAKRVVVTHIKSGTPQHETKRLLELAHKLAKTKNS